MLYKKSIILEYIDLMMGNVNSCEYIKIIFEEDSLRSLINYRLFDKSYFFFANCCKTEFQHRKNRIDNEGFRT